MTSFSRVRTQSNLLHKAPGLLASGLGGISFFLFSLDTTRSFHYLVSLLPQAELTLPLTLFGFRNPFCAPLSPTVYKGVISTSLLITVVTFITSRGYLLILRIKSGYKRLTLEVHLDIEQVKGLLLSYYYNILICRIL